MDTERERDRGEHWEEPTPLEISLVTVWGFLIDVKEKIKDIIYEITKRNN